MHKGVAFLLNNAINYFLVAKSTVAIDIILLLW